MGRKTVKDGGDGEADGSGAGGGLPAGMPGGMPGMPGMPNMGSMMPGGMPGMVMPGMAPSMSGMPPGMTPGMPGMTPGMPGMMPGMPGMPGMMPGMPGMNPSMPGMMNPMQMMMNPLMMAGMGNAGMPAAAASAAAPTVAGPAVSDPVDPRVKALCKEFGLDEGITKKLHDVMKSREDYDEDIQALHQVMEKATRQGKKPLETMLTQMRAIKANKFPGKDLLDKEIWEFALKYNLDDRVLLRLIEVLRTRKGTKSQDLRALDDRLGNAQQPTGLGLLVRLIEGLEETGRLPSPPRRLGGSGTPHSAIHARQQAAERERQKNKSRGNSGQRRSRSRSRRSDSRRRGRSR